MDEKIKYFKIWSTAVNKAAEALRKGDLKSAEKFHQQMEDAYERYREAFDYENQMLDSKFAALNSTLESALPRLFVKNSDALKECINVIKSDKNLLSQFRFCNALRRYNGNSDAHTYINESLDLISKDIDMKTLKESNRKLAKLMIKYKIKPINEISDADKKFADSCDYLLTHKKKLSNLNEITDSINNINSYIVENKKANENKIDILAMAEQVEKKLNSLNEAEQSLVKDIMMANTAKSENRRQDLFSKLKNECIKKINDMISENDGNDKERLMNLKETILMKEYDKDNVVKDIAKLLEIGAVLSDNEHDKYL